ncbi:MAG: hypothetical protein FJ225_07240 [Lentisphaerae bacterium]|nr:hypothetical protein [Lentisphaerota bacterium]
MPLLTILTILLAAVSVRAGAPAEKKITPSRADSPSYDGVRADIDGHKEKRVTWKAIQFTHVETRDSETGEAVHKFTFVAADAVGAFGDTTRAFAFSFTGNIDAVDTAASKAQNLAQPEANRVRQVSGEIVGAVEFEHPTGRVYLIPELDDVVIDVLPDETEKATDTKE